MLVAWNITIKKLWNKEIKFLISVFYMYKCGHKLHIVSIFVNILFASVIIVFLQSVRI